MQRFSPSGLAAAEEKYSSYTSDSDSSSDSSDAEDGPRHALRQLEAELTELAFGGAAASEARRARLEQERARILALDNIQRDFPCPDPHPPCNRKGEILTPSQQCAASTAQGEQCRRRTRDGAYCPAHLKREMGLRIGKVPGYGRGVFATRPFAVGERITPYVGDVEVGPASHGEHGGSKYVLARKADVSVDAARRNTAPGRLINDPRGMKSPTGARLRANCKFAIDHARRRIFMVATAPVNTGDQLLVPYGNAFWQQELKLQKEAKLAVEQRAADRARRAAAQLRRRAKVVASLSDASSFSAEALASTLQELREPHTLKEALATPEAQAWMAELLAEQQRMESMDAYVPVQQLPPGAKLIATRLVMKRKRKPDGSVARYKVRPVARGFLQQYGLHYDQVTSNVLHIKTLRFITAVCCRLGFELHSLDVDLAYLHADLDRELYITVPDGFVVPSGTVALRLNKALYGLKQSGRLFNQKLVGALDALGFWPCEFGDGCLFIKRSRTNRPLFVATYVDDIPYGFHPADADEMREFLTDFKRTFKIKELGPVRSLLGITFQRDGTSIKLHQAAYAEQVLAEFGFEHAKPEATPESKGALHTRGAELGKLTLESVPSVVGALSWLTNCTRPDLAHAVNMVQRQQSNPSEETLLRIVQILRYLKGTTGLGIKYSTLAADGDRPVAYSDSDWAGEADGASTSGMVIILAGGAVSWSCEKQASIALSSTEAEYIAACEAAREIAWMRILLDEMLILPQDPPPTPLLIDNTAAITMILAENPSGSVRRKHINVKHHYVREQARVGALIPSFIPTEQQLADLFTKPLAVATFTFLRDQVLGFSSELRL